ncbi:hypothetical protein MLD38_019621 [Melastoma candidum]|uniref:Uncharacterized protein n=1 Tax=Melastoma candidum TaxID=119954 RepID=A0ACB9QXK4_9MYRT|nr:hypothetical protein MLD38_019621 [Melastoma candidum]
MQTHLHHPHHPQHQHNPMQGILVGSEIHGFYTLQDLGVHDIMEEASSRWLRPNEIHAILCNYKYFTVSAKPVNLPTSGTIILFDRKMLRNFRRDGHNWKKKKDGKTVKEAHEHLKVGNEERIHVYYAHGQDNPTFVRRCYWLLDKSLEHIVLVHYRETYEVQGSPATPVHSNSSSTSEPTSRWIISEESDSSTYQAYYPGHKEPADPRENLTAQNHEMRLHEINTLEWEELVTNEPNNSHGTKGGPQTVSSFQAQTVRTHGSIVGNGISQTQAYPFGKSGGPTAGTLGVQENSVTLGRDYPSTDAQFSADLFSNDVLHGQESFQRWMNYIMTDSTNSEEDAAFETPNTSRHPASSFSMEDHAENSAAQDMIFTITEIGPSWGLSTEKTKVLITGFFNEPYSHHAKSNLVCICGDVPIPAQVIQLGVYRCLVPAHPPGLLNLYMSFDGHTPISQAVHFECRAPPSREPLPSAEDVPKREELQLQTRLAFLIFSTSRCLDIASDKVPLSAQKEGKKFLHKSTNFAKDWAYLLGCLEEDKMALPQAKRSLFELVLKNRLKDWVLERVITGGRMCEYDVHGQGVIHLCAVLGYTWAIDLFSMSGLSLDFRDKHGWTALHWAAHRGSERMVAKLLSVGAKANLVSDPTSDNPGGCTPADLASRSGYDGVAAYLAEKSLVQQFKDMSLAGNITGSLQTATNETINAPDISEEEMFLKDTLAAYRTAADAAARIQNAFREHSLKIRTKQVHQSSIPENEARDIIAAMQIQHAYRNFDSRKRMAAAVRIQYRFRTWKMRKDFLNLRRQAIKIQAAFRGFQVRRHYRKILWSVGVLEKAVLRWRMKRKGFRGLHVPPLHVSADDKQESDTEEDFFRTSRRQAEERLERSVVRVQAMFRSKKAQEQYRRMKVAHGEAELEYEEMFDHSEDMER